MKFARLSLWTTVSFLLLTGCASTPSADNIPDTEVPSTAGSPAIATTDPATAQTAVMKTAWAVHWAGQTQTAQAKPTRTPEAEGQSLPRPTQTTTPLPTSVPTVTPSGPLSPSGPWLLGRNSSAKEWTHNSYLWASNPDMSGLTRLIEEPVIAYAVRPMDTIAGGLTIAYVTKPFYESVDLTLKIVTLPGGIPQTVASLYQAARDSEFQQYDLEEALRYDGLVWSPDGRTLAFAGGIDGISVDLYTYNLDTAQIKRLSDGSLNTYRMRWSLDGQYIIYEGFHPIGMGGPFTEAIWSVPANGGENISLVDESLGYLDYYGPIVYGWLSPTQILLGTTYYEAQDSLQTVSVDTGAIDYIAHAQYDHGAYSPEHHTWLLTRTRGAVETLGTALILCRGSDCQVVSSLDIPVIWWSGIHDSFFGIVRDGGLYKISPDGEVTKLPVRLKEFTERTLPVTESPDGALWAWHSWADMAGSTKVYLGAAMAQPQVILDKIQSLVWSPDSQHLLLLNPDNVMVASSPDFEPALAVEGWSVVDISWVP